MQKSYFETR